MPLPMTWTDTTYKLGDCDPIATSHKDCVSFHVPGYRLEGAGFAIHFNARNIPAVEKLLDALRRLEQGE